MNNIISKLHHHLLARQASNGFWGPNNGCVEPTCLAVLALRKNGKAEIQSAIEGLLKLQNGDGSWPSFGTDHRVGSWTTALAILSLISIDRGSQQLERGIRWLMRTRGREGGILWKLKFKLVDRDVQFDPTKYGWSWMEGTTSWVIPTAFSLIGLRRAQQRFEAGPDLTWRTRLGTAMLLNRMCPGGGWNAGNGVAFGVPYLPFIDATSIALLALRGHDDQPGVAQSLSWLRRHIDDCPAPYSLAWGIIALAAYRDADMSMEEVLAQANQALVGVVAERVDRMDTETLAISALALGAHQGDNVFEIAA